MCDCAMVPSVMCHKHEMSGQEGGHSVWRITCHHCYSGRTGALYICDDRINGLVHAEEWHCALFIIVSAG